MGLLGAFLFRQLPDDVAYHFRDGIPDRWLSRGSLLLWALLPQIICTLLAFLVTRLTLLGARYMDPENTVVKRVLPVMGNLLAMPQVILFFAILDIFLYNIYRIKLPPTWIFAIIIMALGGIFLAIFFMRTIRQFRHTREKTDQE